MTISLKKMVDKNHLNPFHSEMKSEMMIVNQKHEIHRVTSNEIFKEYRILEDKEAESFMCKLAYFLFCPKNELKALDSDGIQKVYELARKSETVKFIITNHLKDNMTLRQRDLSVFQEIVEMEQNPNKGKEQQTFIFCIGNKRHEVLTDKDAKKLINLIKYGDGLYEKVDLRCLHFYKVSSPLAKQFIEGIQKNNLKFRQKDIDFLPKLFEIDKKKEEQEKMKAKIIKLMDEVKPAILS
jgi:hypothetical protein